MELRKLKAVFGGLEGAELELSAGLNVLQSKNEGGKSTWSRLIRAMFYGISTSERVSKGGLPDKIRYLPWSGAPMQGRMELRWRNEELTITRTAAGTGKPFGLPSVIYTDSGEHIPALQGADAGEKLLGVTEPVFRRSAYLSGNDLRIDPDRDLEKRLLSLVTSGEELASAREAEERLRRWQRKRRWRNAGTVPEMERSLEEKEGALRRIEEGTKRLASLRLDRDRLERQQEDLRLELRLHKRDALLAARRRWAAADQEARELTERTETLERERAGRSGETADDLRAAALRYREAEKDRAAMASALKEAGEELAALPDPEQIPREPGRGLGITLILLGALLCCAGVPALLHVIPSLPGWAGYILLACVLLLIPGILRLRSVGRHEEEMRQERRLEIERGSARAAELERQLEADEQETAECLAALEEMKKTALCAPGEDPMAAADRIDDLLRELEKTRSGAETARKVADTLSASLEEEPEDLEGEVTMSREEAERRLGETERALRETERTLNRDEAVFNLLGDPLVLASEAEDLRERIRTGEGELSALDLAEQALADAGRQMQNRFAPLIGREAGEMFKGLTGGRYTGLYFDRDLHFAVQRAGDLEPRALEYLSEGTKNQLYLAVRLAICRLALPTEDPCPLILDDVLLTFDDERARRALEVLLELGKERQLLLFTCSGRERELLRDLGREDVCRLL